MRKTRKEKRTEGKILYENFMKSNLNFNVFKVLPAEGGPPISLRLGGSASIPIAGVGGRFGDEATVPEAAEVFYKKI